MDNNSVRFGFVGDARRLAEILSVAGKYKLARGLSPEKVCAVFKELGPAFIKTGQMLSLHPEVLPESYCEAFRQLRTDAPSITASQIRDLITEEYGRPWNTVFSRFAGVPEGSASIAQVHEADLLDGTRVAVKIQRPDTYQVMEQDIRLLKRALGVLKLSQLQDKLWLIDNAIDEVWRVAQQEMDFLHEAENIERMAAIMEPMAFSTVPKVYHEYTTRNVLVMEYVEGIDLNENDRLTAAGYDLREILHKLGRSYIKQWLEDGFFQADPHPGNIRIRDGQIVWLDLGMTGELSREERDAMHHCMHAVLKKDMDELMTWGWKLFDMPEDYPQRDALEKEIIRMIDKYASMAVHRMTHSQDLIDDLFGMLQTFDINVPLNLNMYGRSLVVMEGNIPALDPDCSFLDIFGAHLAAYSIGDGKAGEIARKLSHRKLISGKQLRHGAYQEEDRDPTDRELLSGEEYAILSAAETSEE